MLIYISYTRPVLSSGYKKTRFIKPSNIYIVLRALNPNNKSRKKIRQHCSRKLLKRIRKEERLSFPKSQKYIGKKKMLRGIYLRISV